jgi:hypothetical protein
MPSVQAKRFLENYHSTESMSSRFRAGVRAGSGQVPRSLSETFGFRQEPLERRNARLKGSRRDRKRDSCELGDTLAHSIPRGIAKARFAPAPASVFPVIVLVTLTLGIGANTAIFSLVNGVLIKPLPYPQAESLVGPDRQRRRCQSTPCACQASRVEHRVRCSA